MYSSIFDLGGQEWRRAQRNKKGCYARKYKDIIREEKNRVSTNWKAGKTSKTDIPG